MRITQIEVNKLRPGKRRILWDDDLRGFGVRITEGAISYLVDFKATDGRKRKVIGSCSVLTAAQARDRARDILASVTLTGLDPLLAFAPAAAPKTFRDVWREMIDTVDAKILSARTVTDYEARAAKSILPRIGDRPIAAISVGEARQLVADVNGDREKEYVATLVKKTINFAIEGQVLPPNHLNPMNPIKFKRRETRKRALDEDEITKFGRALAEMESEGKVSPWLANLFRLSLICGLRPGEAQSLIWQRVNIPKRRMVVVGKTGEREVILPQEAIAVLEATPRIQGCEYVFAGKRFGRPIVGVHKVLHSVSARAGIDRFRPHDFRHTAGTGALAAGADVRAVQALLGHADLKTTALYLHASDKRRNEAADAAARFARGVSRRIK